MAKSILIFGVLVFSALQASAFDKIFCQSSMHDWIVTLTESSKTAILTPYRTSTTLSEKESETIYIKNAANELVATAFPWNGLHVRKNKNLSLTYVISSSENPRGFSIEIKDLKTTKDHILTCRFTF